MDGRILAQDMRLSCIVALLLFQSQEYAARQTS
jgi:hypothetical protein